MNLLNLNFLVVSRKVLLEPCLEQLKHHIQNKEEYKMCTDILGDILASLHTIGKVSG